MLVLVVCVGGGGDVGVDDVRGVGVVDVVSVVVGVIVILVEVVVGGGVGVGS